MISFRLTDEEYDSFRRLCVSRGLRNVSELVRTAVNQLIDQAGPDLDPPLPEVVVRVATLESRLADLATLVAQMESRFASKHLNNHSEPVHFAQATGQ
jgi:Arc/MetJ-type ribon-helix-helix transcriptional regulator